MALNTTFFSTTSNALKYLSKDELSHAKVIDFLENEERNLNTTSRSFTPLYINNTFDLISYLYLDIESEKQSNKNKKKEYKDTALLKKLSQIYETFRNYSIHMLN